MSCASSEEAPQPFIDNTSEAAEQRAAPGETKNRAVYTHPPVQKASKLFVASLLVSPDQKPVG
jgi:hypothetical protein